MTRSIFQFLQEKLHKEDEIWEITKHGIQGKINWEEGLRTRVAALKGIDEKMCQDVSDALPIMTGAKYACKVLKGGRLENYGDIRRVYNNDGQAKKGAGS